MTTVSNLPSSWLRECTDLAHLKMDFDVLPAVVRDQMLSDLRDFTIEMEPGDELWRYSSPKETWERKSGSAGVAIVRKGEVVKSLQLMMN